MTFPPAFRGALESECFRAASYGSWPSDSQPWHEAENKEAICLREALLAHLCSCNCSLALPGAVEKANEAILLCRCLSSRQRMCCLLGKGQSTQLVPLGCQILPDSGVQLHPVPGNHDTKSIPSCRIQLRSAAWSRLSDLDPVQFRQGHGKSLT